MPLNYVPFPVTVAGTQPARELPTWFIQLAKECSDAEYEAFMRQLEAQPDTRRLGEECQPS